MLSDQRETCNPILEWLKKGYVTQEIGDGVHYVTNAWASILRSA